MKKLLTIILISICSLTYGQGFYNHQEFYEKVNVGYDTLYKENGSIKQIGKVSYDSNGEKHGEWIVWDNNGVVRIKMFYQNGKRSGTWKIYNQNGILINERDYIASN